MNYERLQLKQLNRPSRSSNLNTKSESVNLEVSKSNAFVQYAYLASAKLNPLSVKSEQTNTIRTQTARIMATTDNPPSCIGPTNYHNSSFKAYPEL